MPRDDLGNPVSLTRSSTAIFFRPLGRGDRAILLRAIDQRVAADAPSRYALALVGSWVPAFVVMIATSFAGLPFPWFMGAFFVAMSVAFVVLAIWLIAIHRRGRTVIDACLASGRCPACLYPVADNARSPDHMTRCAECGAAWRLP